MDRALNATRPTQAVSQATTAALQSYMDWLLLAAWAMACMAGLWQQQLQSTCLTSDANWLTALGLPMLRHSGTSVLGSARESSIITAVAICVQNLE